MHEKYLADVSAKFQSLVNLQVSCLHIQHSHHILRPRQFYYYYLIIFLGAFFTRTFSFSISLKLLKYTWQTKTNSSWAPNLTMLIILHTCKLQRGRGGGKTSVLSRATPVIFESITVNHRFVILIFRRGRQIWRLSYYDRINYILGWLTI